MFDIESTVDKLPSRDDAYLLVFYTDEKLREIDWR